MICILWTRLSYFLISQGMYLEQSVITVVTWYPYL